MKYIPQDVWEKLEFDRVIELACSKCLGPIGIRQLTDIQVETEAEVIAVRLAEVAECKLFLDSQQALPLSQYEAIDSEMELLSSAGHVLDLEGVGRIRHLLRISAELISFFDTKRQKKAANLWHSVAALRFEENILEQLETWLDADGQIRENATPKLSDAHGRIRRKIVESDRVFNRVIKQYQPQNVLTDHVESYRNGRRVLSVLAEHKRKVKGIIHDESSTGRTVFIEPEEIVLINNELFDLEQEKRREIHRILRQISDILRPVIPMLHATAETIGALDAIRAKALLAQDMDAECPEIPSDKPFGIYNGRHPLLYLKNRAEGKTTIPFDLELRASNRIVVISGPNAGGKTVLMKAIGLLQLMMQAGFLLPVDARSHIPILERLFVDIGDQQSLEDDLSTYSSRLKNMNAFLQHLNTKTLVLIDEFGSGTDPKIGGAIAEAILAEMHRKRSFAIVTTHYSNLKVFAFKNKGVLNASMLFDQEALRPTYRFKLGAPGSSFAFEIAEQSGLSGKVIAYARKRTGKNEYAVDHLLSSLQRDQRRLTERLEAAEEKENQLERLIRTYENMARDLEFKRKKHKLEVKEWALQRASDQNREAEKWMRKLRETEKSEEAKKIAERSKQAKEDLVEDVQSLKKELFYDQSTTKQSFTTGDFVKLRTGSAPGKIVRLAKDKAEVMMGAIRIEVPLVDLVMADEPLDVRTGQSVRTDLATHGQRRETTLDIRGYRRDEALRSIEQFVESALIQNSSLLRIVHGKGNGILKKAVVQKLKEYKEVREITHPPDEHGGEGVTHVLL